MDKQSGKDFQRASYQKMIKQLKNSDVVVVKSIDRLGRNYDEILEQWRVITKEKGAAIVVLDMPLLDTRMTNIDLTGVFIADLVLQLLSYVAETERENIRQRQTEGIAVAKENGVQFGRPKKEKPENFLLVCEEYWNDDLTMTEAACKLEVSRSTFKTWYFEDFLENKKNDFF